MTHGVLISPQPHDYTIHSPWCVLCEIYLMTGGERRVGPWRPAHSSQGMKTRLFRPSWPRIASTLGFFESLSGYMTLFQGEKTLALRYTSLGGPAAGRHTKLKAPGKQGSGQNISEGNINARKITARGNKANKHKWWKHSLTQDNNTTAKEFE